MKHRAYYEVIDINLEKVYYQGYKRDVAAKHRLTQRMQGKPTVAIVTPKNGQPTVLSHL